MQILQFADDSTVILDGSNTSLLHQALKTLELFERISGLKGHNNVPNVII